MIKGAQRGNWQGARYTPYGYSYNKLDPEKKLRVVKEEAEIVKMIYAMYLSGQSTQQIAGYLYKKGYKTRSGGKFNTKLVCDILKSQVYLGHLVWNTHHYDKKQKTLKGCKYIKNDPSTVVIYKGRHESIISQEDFDAVQKRLEQARKGVVRKCNSNEYPLTWLLICPRCGNRFQGCVNTATRENKITKTKRRYYRCAARQTYDLNCDNSYARAEELEAEVYSIIDVMFEGDIDEARMLNLIRNSSEPQSEGIEKDLSDKKSELAKNIRQQEKLSKIYREELLAIEAYKTQIIPLRDEEKDLKAKIKKLELSLVER
jgi:site-specific DNA recombinase